MDETQQQQQQETTEQLTQPQEAAATTPDVVSNVPPEELAAMYEFYQNAQRERQLNELKSEWGEEFDSTYEQVGQFFTQVPKEYQNVVPALNNAFGARLIAKAMRYDAMMQNQQQVPGATPPTVDRKSPSAVSQPTGQNKFTRSQIRAMSPSDYRQNRAAIDAAYAAGLVENDL